MFTGLIQQVGRLRTATQAPGGWTLTIGHDAWDPPLVEGESIAVQGVCLTAVRCGRDRFACDVLEETRARSNLADKRPGGPLNLERALRTGDRLGGHFVSGHVDGTGRVLSLQKAGPDWVLTVACGAELLPEIVTKGSVAVDGVSLTVSAVDADRFEVRLIPYTLRHTSLDTLATGDRVNIETDLLAKYARRGRAGREHGPGLDEETLRRTGFA